MNDHPLDPLLDPTPRDTPRPASGRGARRPSGSRRSGDRGQQRTGAPRAGGGRPPQRRGGASIAQWLPAVAAIGLLGTVVLAGVALGGGDDGSGQIGQGEPASVAPVPTNAPLTVPESVPDVTTPLADAPEADKVPLERTLSKGLAGDDVSRVQERLTELGFVPGPADGIYGDQTIKAVWAYEKLVMGVASNEPTGKVTPEMWDRMQDNFRINPRRPNAPSANHTEVYLPEQVLAVFHDDTPVMITHMSSGTGEEWCEEVTISPGEYGNRDGEEPLVRGECGISNTPGGVFQFYRQVEGIRDSALGSMWNPMYFNYGIAIHGALNVPLQPASHGCIRIPLNISEGLQDIVAMNDMIYVWDGEKEPEENGSPPPTFNWLDPDYETTTTSSTTTVPETTTTLPADTVPDTTQAPATTQAPDTTAAPTTAAPTTDAPATTAAPTTLAPPPPDDPPGSGDGGDDGG